MANNDGKITEYSPSKKEIHLAVDENLYKYGVNYNMSFTHILEYGILHYGELEKEIESHKRLYDISKFYLQGRNKLEKAYDDLRAKYLALKTKYENTSMDYIKSSEEILDELQPEIQQIHNKSYKDIVRSKLDVDIVDNIVKIRESEPIDILEDNISKEILDMPTKPNYFLLKRMKQGEIDIVKKDLQEVELHQETADSINKKKDLNIMLASLNKDLEDLVKKDGEQKYEIENRKAIHKEEIEKYYSSNKK